MTSTTNPNVTDGRYDLTKGPALHEQLWKDSRQKVKGFGYMTVWGVFKAREVRTLDRYDFGERVYGWIKGGRVNTESGWELVVYLGDDRWATAGSLVHSDVVHLEEPSYFEREKAEREARLAEKAEDSPAADGEYEFTLTEPDILEVSVNGRIIGDLHIMPSGRYQPVRPWDHKTFENKIAAADHLRSLR